MYSGKEYNKEYYKKYPWQRVYSNIVTRCKKGGLYYKRGIRNYLTKQDIKRLWYRDKAYRMSCPSIDRRGGGHYRYVNCRFIEKSDNSRVLGEKHSQAKMTDIQVLAARFCEPKDRKERTLYIKRLMKTYNLTYTPVLNMLNRKSWKHL